LFLDVAEALCRVINVLLGHLTGSLLEDLGRLRGGVGLDAGNICISGRPDVLGILLSLVYVPQSFVRNFLLVRYFRSYDGSFVHIREVDL